MMMNFSHLYDAHFGMTAIKHSFVSLAWDIQTAIQHLL